MKTNRKRKPNMVQRWIEALRKISKAVDSTPTEAREIFNLAMLLQF